ncbi:MULTISPECIES: ScbR family autoregulator-binding transcription factor [unclassified Streptomyces]|uniref:ScbR family autoregulator-binding transcription factor n=1 Tax=unclassified Streptomyces TaxID=2593676 RepID=UPI0006B0639A|nr:MULTISPECIES: ScbR family autoregulator-binding transcription factor [unclassified Streptomyces]KOX36064.1 gamma-butyrolactone-binding protein [Streptomyces sp. NRRL F-6491]KOX51445.1 gamma-butyrolactone-binding protein [Streptomyces sp. NRRL F-6492]
MAMQPRAVRTRQDLIRSAAVVFERAGFADASIAAISSGAGVSNGALHFHFRNKQALGEAVELAASQTLVHVTGRVPLRHPSPLQLLVDTSQVLAECLLHDPVLRAGFSLASDATWQGRINLWEEWQDWVQLMLIVARERDMLTPHVVVEEAVLAITSIVAGFEVLSRIGGEWTSRSAVTGFWRLMLPQLAGPETAAALLPEGTDCPLSAQDWDMAETCGAA